MMSPFLSVTFKLEGIIAIDLVVSHEFDFVALFFVINQWSIEVRTSTRSRMLSSPMNSGSLWPPKGRNLPAARSVVCLSLRHALHVNVSRTRFGRWFSCTGRH